MTLRINTNLAAIRALKNLRSTDRAQQTSLERLSTGLRINRASDDPSGLVISEQLRGQISGLKQASENTQNAMSMIGTADAALQQVADLLNDIRQSAVFALNSGAASPDQIAAEQASVDQAINAINRIAQTTRFADGALLNGTRGYNITLQDASIKNLDLRRVAFAPGTTSRSYAATYTAATQRTLAAPGAVGVSGATIRVTGALGSREISFVAGTAAADVAAAINAVAEETGVYVSAGFVRTEGYGSEQYMNVELLAGGVGGLSLGSNTGTAGVDGVLLIDGQSFTGEGLHFSIHTGSLDADLDIAPATGSGAIATFLTVANSGVEFQVNETASPNDRIALGIRDISASRLGFDTQNDVLAAAAAGVLTVTEGGFLSSLQTGSTNDLTSNPGNALKILDAALAQISGLRGFIGGVQAFNLEPNLNNLEVSIENITAAESSIRDLDFAAETAEFTRTQVLFQSGVAVLGSANLIPQTVLTLLQ